MPHAFAWGQIFAPANRQSASLRGAWWLATLLGVTMLVWFVYARILELGFTGWDTLMLLQRHRVDSLSDLWQVAFQPLTRNAAFYRPISQLSFALDYLTWGMTPAGYHLTDILLHLWVSLGIVLLGYFASGKRIWVGALCGLLFASHPVLATTVQSIAQRMDVLVTLGLVWCLVLAYAAFQRTGWQALMLSIFSALAFLLALGAKETGWVALPLLLLLCSALLWRKGWRSVLLAALPFIAIALAYALLYRSIIPGKPGDDTFWNGMALDVPYLYLSQIVIPNALARARGPLFAIFLIALTAVILQARGDRRYLRWVGLAALWLAGLLFIYMLVGIDRFVTRYAYGVVAAAVFLVGTAFTARLDHTLFARLRTGALIGLVLTWLVTSTLVQLPLGAMRREQSATEYLAQLDQIIADTPTGATIDLENVPPKLVYLDGVSLWLDLKWGFKQIKIGTQTQVLPARGHPTLLVARNPTDGRATIRATYDNSFSDEED